MRVELKAIVGTRGRWRGVFVRYGAIADAREATLVLRDLSRVDVEPAVCVADHLWFANAGEFKRLRLAAGDVVEFGGMVTAYKKRARGVFRNSELHAQDYQISNPYDVRVVSPAP